MTTLEIQKRLQELGFYTGNIDGVEGPHTRLAIIGFKMQVGLQARAYVGPVTIQALKGAKVSLPWLRELNAVFGYHEARDKATLSAWLKSDGPTLGDPTKLPWCGDAVETAVYLALPNEPLIVNPYWARNWAGFGIECGPVFGAIAVFGRGSGGHVGFLVGVNRDGTLLRIRGGNQSNAVNDTWIAANRLLAYRWPSTWPTSAQRPAPMLDSTGGVVSTNEA